jgi:hypothetical protein
MKSVLAQERSTGNIFVQPQKGKTNLLNLKKGVSK